MKRLVVALAVVIGVLGMPAPASSVDLHLIVGLVTDRLGRPLPGVTIADGNGRTATTSATGEYSLSVPTGSHTITASHNTVDPATATVEVAVSTLETRKDFVLYYLLRPTVDPAYVSTATAAGRVVVTAATGAPDPGTPGVAGRSCVNVQDRKTGTTWAASYWTTSGGLAYWRHTIDVPTGSAEDKYWLWVRTVDCASGAPLSVAAVTHYTVDNTAPEIPLKSLLPADGTNTVHGAAQPLAATVQDGLSGVLSSSIRFTLYDADGDEVFKSGSTSSTRITWNSLTGRASSPAVPSLETGKLHYLVVTAKDKAGNETTRSHTSGILGGGFLPTTVGPQGTTASIPGSTCTVGTEVLATGPNAGTKRVTCPSVSARLATTSIMLGGVRHIDSGYVSQAFGLDTALVSGTVGGAPASWPAHRGDDPNWGAKTRSMRYSVDLSSSQELTAEVPAADVGLGTLVTYVPAAFDGPTAQLHMGAVSTDVSTPTCADPAASTAAVPCSPDPLDSRFIVTLKETADVASAVARHTSQLGVVLRSNGGRAYSAFVPPESRQALAGDADVAGVRRETASSEFHPDDWGDTIGDLDESAVAQAIRAEFGARFGGDWIDRSVMPSQWRVAVKNLEPADQSRLAAITAGSDRITLQDVDHSEADFDSYIQTAMNVLQSHGITAVGYSPRYSIQRLEIEVTTITEAARTAVLAALPSGVPSIATGVQPGTPAHQNRFTGMPLEGGLSVLRKKEPGGCTTSFAIKRLINTTIHYGGAGAGHCFKEDETVQLQKPGDGAGENAEFEILWSGWYSKPNWDTIKSDGATWPMGTTTKDVTKDVLVWSDDHRRINGKLMNADLKEGTHTCFQGVTSAHLDGTGTFDNCGPLGSVRKFARVGTDLDNRKLEKSWCFAPVTGNDGDSGGPVYKPKKPNLKIMGIFSYTTEFRPDPPADVPIVVVPGTHSGASGGTDDGAPKTNQVKGCMTSIQDFESESGWSLHY